MTLPGGGSGEEQRAKAEPDERGQELSEPLPPFLQATGDEREYHCARMGSERRVVAALSVVPDESP